MEYTNFGELELACYREGLEYGRKRLKACLERYDENLAETRNDGKEEYYRLIDKRENTIKTLMGPVTYLRRYYKVTDCETGEKSHQFLLDKKINLDMIGRFSYQYMQQDKDYVYIVRDKLKSGNLTEWIEPINASTTQLTLDYEYSSPEDPKSLFNFSDNYSFAQKGIPSVSFTSGEHKDYHKPSDDEKLIDYDALLKRTKLAFLVVWELANSDKKPIKN